MTRSFVLTLALEDSSDPSTVALELEQVLSEHFDVVQVNPWDSPSSTPGAIVPTTFPTL